MMHVYILESEPEDTEGLDDCVHEILGVFANYELAHQAVLDDIVANYKNRYNLGEWRFVSEQESRVCAFLKKSRITNAEYYDALNYTLTRHEVHGA